MIPEHGEKSNAVVCLTEKQVLVVILFRRAAEILHICSVKNRIIIKTAFFTGFGNVRAVAYFFFCGGQPFLRYVFPGRTAGCVSEYSVELRCAYKKMLRKH